MFCWFFWLIRGINWNFWIFSKFCQFFGILQNFGFFFPFFFSLFPTFLHKFGHFLALFWTPFFGVSRFKMPKKGVQKRAKKWQKSAKKCQNRPPFLAFLYSFMAKRGSKKGPKSDQICIGILENCHFLSKSDHLITDFRKKCHFLTPFLTILYIQIAIFVKKIVIFYQKVAIWLLIFEKGVQKITLFCIYEARKTKKCS